VERGQYIGAAAATIIVCYCTRRKLLAASVTTKHIRQETASGRRIVVYTRPFFNDNTAATLTYTPGAPPAHNDECHPARMPCANSKILKINNTQKICGGVTIDFVE